MWEFSEVESEVGDVTSVVIGHAFGALVEDCSFFKPGEGLLESRHDHFGFLHSGRIIFFLESHDIDVQCTFLNENFSILERFPTMQS